MSRFLPRLAQLAAVAVTLLGAFVLAMWQIGTWQLAALGAAYVPMAPITAALFALLGLGQAARLHRTGWRIARWFEAGGAVMTAAVAALVLTQAVADFPLPWDRWFAAARTYVGMIHTGSMAPLTALTFLLLAAAILTRARMSGLARWISSLLPWVGFGVAFLVMVAYAAGAPFDYEDATVPMALSTALAFLATNSCLILSGPEAQATQRWLERTFGAQVDAPARRLMQRIAAIVCALVGLIVLAGIVYVRSEQAAARDTMKRELNSVLELKVAAIGQWRAERLDEGYFLQRTPGVDADIVSFLRHRDDAGARARLLAWLLPIRGVERYTSIMLYDAKGQLQLAIPEATGAPGSVDELRTGSAGTEVVLGDLQPGRDGRPAYLDLLVPIRSLPSPGAPAGTVAAPIATLLLRLNPAAYLYPLLGQWPVPSETAEMVLVRTEGSEVVVLNPLRHRPDSAFALRRPVGDRLLPAAMAARGEYGLRDGIDYRGVPVLAAIESIPGSPWSVIAKIDRAEAFAPVRWVAWRSAATIVLLLVLVALSGAFLWRHWDTVRLQRALEVEHDRTALAERLALVMRHANDIILIMDETGRILEANHCAISTYGYTHPELCALPPGGLRGGAAVADFGARIQDFLSPTGARFETVHQRKDGSMFPIEVSGRVVEIADRRYILGIFRDITARRQAEAALRKSQVLLAKTAETAKMGGWEIDLATMALSWTEQIYRIYELPLDFQPTVPGTIEFYAPESRPVIAEAVRRAVELGETFDLDLCLLTAKGNRRQVHALGQAHHTNGVATRVSGTFQDVTERKQAEVALRESEELKRATFEQAAVGIAHVDTDGRWLLVNNKLCAIVGYSNAELLQLTFQEVTYHDDQAPELDFVRQVLAGEIDSYSLEKRYVRKNRSLVWVNLTVSLVRTPAGEPKHFIAVVEDIDKRKQSEAVLRASEERFRSLAMASSQIIWHTDGNGQVRDKLPSFQSYTGQTEEEIKGDGWGAALHPDDAPRTLAVWRRAVADRVTYETEYRLRRSDGVYREFAVRGVPVLAEDGRVLEWIGACADISVRKQAEQRIRDLATTLEQRVVERTAELEAVNKELEAFSYSVSHDLRAPLRVIAGYARILTEDYEQALGPGGQAVVDVVVREAQRMDVLVNNLLNLSRFSQLPLDLQPLDMTGLFRQVGNELLGGVDDRTIQLTVLPVPEAKVDRSLMQQVLVNLLSNAIKYTARREAAAITVSGSVTGGEAVYCVTDNGAGFNMRHVDRLFGVFQRLHTDEEFDGIGIGLALVQRIVRRHGGRVWAEGREGEGAKFFFSLPLPPAPPRERSGSEYPFPSILPSPAANETPDFAAGHR